MNACDIFSPLIGTQPRIVFPQITTTAFSGDRIVVTENPSRSETIAYETSADEAETEKEVEEHLIKDNLDEGIY